MKIVSFNLRCPWKNYDGINDMVHRIGFIYDKIKTEKPSVIAFQEVREEACEALQKILPEYEFFGTLREEGYSVEGLYTAIRKDGFSFIGNEVFWLSPTPFVVGSRFENQSECSRICLVSKIRNKTTNEVVRVLNVHLDHISDQAKILGLKCVYEFLDEYEKKQKLPSVLLGDFNAQPQDETIQFAKSKEGLFEVTEDIKITFHNFGDPNDQRKLDYIFLSNELKDRVQGVELWTDNKDGIYLSDHYPVCLTLRV